MTSFPQDGLNILEGHANDDKKNIFDILMNINGSSLTSNANTTVNTSTWSPAVLNSAISYGPALILLKQCILTNNPLLAILATCFKGMDSIIYSITYFLFSNFLFIFCRK